MFIGATDTTCCCINQHYSCRTASSFLAQPKRPKDHVYIAVGRELSWFPRAHLLSDVRFVLRSSAVINNIPAQVCTRVRRIITSMKNRYHEMYSRLMGKWLYETKTRRFSWWFSCIRSRRDDLGYSPDEVPDLVSNRVNHIRNNERGAVISVFCWGALCLWR